MKKLVAIVSADGRTADELVDLVMAELTEYRAAGKAGSPKDATDTDPDVPSPKTEIAADPRDKSRGQHP